MKNYFCILLLLLAISFTYGQKSVPLSLNISKNGFSQSQISFEIVEIVDNRLDTSSLGEVHDKYGFLTKYYLEGGLKNNLRDFYDRGYSKASKGEYQVKIVINEMSISEPKESPNDYVIRIEIDYFVASDRDYVLILEDSYFFDRLIESPRHVPKFYQNFLKRSVEEFRLKLNKDHTIKVRNG